MAANKSVRTRFAPSPTGFMHIGNLRTALFSYLIAKKNGGAFILRIEDTDAQRFTPGAVELIYRTLHDTGLIYDEGPDVGGDFGPYVQSERKEIYQKYAQELLDRGGAYCCFCERPAVGAEGEKAFEKDLNDPCKHLTPEQVQEKINSGAPYVIRQKIDHSGQTTYTDSVFGEVTVPNSELDENILIKSDGMPTYNFANVIDDHLMGITHVVRGVEYLSSTPKYNLLYQAFGWDVPVYIHCPPVMKNKSEKLSKRNGDASFEDLLKKGYLQEAIINYIALLGWSPSGEQEKFSLAELTQAFSIEGISKSPAIFDPVKLDWLNGEYIKALSDEAFHQMALPYYEGRLKNCHIPAEKISAMLKPRTLKLTDIPDLIDFIDHFGPYDIAMYTHKKMKTNPENSLEVLEKVLPILESLQDFSNKSLEAAIMGFIEQEGLKTGRVMWPVRVALSGKPTTPCGCTEVAEILGKEESLRRLRFSIDLLSKAL